MVTPITLEWFAGGQTPKGHTAMHMLITINDLKPLTDAELERLEAQLRHILDTHTLTTDDRITIIASLVTIRQEIDHRATLPRVWNQWHN